MKTNRMRSYIYFASIALFVSARVDAQERTCPDGMRSYFGVCPNDEKIQQRAPAPSAIPVNPSSRESIPANRPTSASGHSCFRTGCSPQYVNNVLRNR